MACLPSLQAHKEPFIYAGRAQTEAKGEWELEQWITARTRKESGDHLELDVSAELEFGITDRLQLALYLNSRHHNLDQATGSSKIYSDRSGYEFDGLASELEYPLADAFTESWGLRSIFEPGYRRISKGSGKREDKLSLEFKATRAEEVLREPPSTTPWNPSGKRMGSIGSPSWKWNGRRAPRGRAMNAGTSGLRPGFQPGLPKPI